MLATALQNFPVDTLEYVATPAEALEVPYTESIQEKIDRYALQYGVSKEVMHKIVKAESNYHPTIEGDLDRTCKATGRPVRARGLVQITECYFPEISDSQAFDPDYALEFLAKKLSEGKCYLWTTCPK